LDPALKGDLLSDVQVHTTTHCRFLDRTTLDPAPPKAGNIQNSQYEV